jgi:hypothetical protein
MPELLHLQPGYTVDLSDLRRPITLADHFTLGALCEGLDRMAPGARAALEAVLGYLLAPWLDDCLRTVPANTGSDEGLVEIRLRWRCEAWGGPHIEGRSPTLICPEVVGIGAIWPGYRPGEPHHRPGEDEPRHYGLDFTPQARLRPLPLRLDPVMPVAVAPTGAVILETVQTLPAPDTTLLALLTALFDEFSSYGSPEARDRKLIELLHEDEELEAGEADHTAAAPGGRGGPTARVGVRLRRPGHTAQGAERRRLACGGPRGRPGDLHAHVRPFRPGGQRLGLGDG